jgi:DNA mismatch repair ATPase MutS
MPLVREIASLIEREEWKSPRLQGVAARFKQHGAASVRIARLQRLLWLFEQRDNEILIYISFCLLWSTQLAMAIEAWRKAHGPELVDWLAALGEMEALISISTYAYEHPADPFPAIKKDAVVFDGVAVGHPMLDEAKCVRNTVKLEAGAKANDSQFLVISGSNMSGKSTFLRSIGQNAVLAAMGAPVRCKSLTLSPLAICAAIRIEDSVVDGKSNFLAEMQRLKRMIDMAGEKPILFLADEIMAGTNSHDRRIATEWVVRALVKRGAIGALSTHDLALTEIAANGLPGRNVYFEDSGENGALSFDYVLRTGILARSNALNIAQMLGIDTAAETK